DFARNSRLAQMPIRKRRPQLYASSAPLPKFVIHRSTIRHELRKQRGTSNSMILVPLFDLKFLTEFAATAVGTSNRRHWSCGLRQASWSRDNPRHLKPWG